jgi:hypothetical protein
MQSLYLVQHVAAGLHRHHQVDLQINKQGKYFSLYEFGTATCNIFQFSMISERSLFCLKVPREDVGWSHLCLKVHQLRHRTLPASNSQRPAC